MAPRITSSCSPTAFLDEDFQVMDLRQQIPFVSPLQSGLALSQLIDIQVHTRQLSP